MSYKIEPKRTASFAPQRPNPIVSSGDRMPHQTPPGKFLRHNDLPGELTEEQRARFIEVMRAKGWLKTR